MSSFESGTLRSVRQLAGTQLITMEYSEDYKLDEFMKIGVNSDAEMLAFVVTHLLGGTAMDYALPDMGCSTFSASLEDGERIFGRSFDEEPCPAMMLICRPEKGYASISMVDLAYIGIASLPVPEQNRHFLLAAPYAPIDGINEKGLAVAMLRIRKDPTNQNTGKIGVTTTSAVRMILDRCAAVDEAVELLSSCDMHSSANVDFHFQIADAQGGSVVVEYVNDEMKVIPAKFATNFLLTPDTGIQGSGHDRYEILKCGLAECKSVFKEESDAMKLLRAVSWDATRWSCIYNQTDPSLLLALNRDYENLHTFRLNH